MNLKVKIASDLLDSVFIHLGSLRIASSISLMIGYSWIGSATTKVDRIILIHLHNLYYLRGRYD